MKIDIRDVDTWQYRQTKRDDKARQRASAKRQYRKEMRFNGYTKVKQEEGK